MIITKIIVTILYLICIYLTLKIKTNEQSAVKGIAIGLCYFIMLPLLLAVVLGQVEYFNSDAEWAHYNIDVDGASSYYMFCFCTAFIFFTGFLLPKSNSLYYNSIYSTDTNYFQIPRNCFKQSYVEYGITATCCLVILISFQIVFNSLGLKWTEHNLYMSNLIGGQLYSMIKIMSVSLMIVCSLIIQSVIKAKGESILLTFFYFFLPLYEMLISGNRIYVFTFSILYLILNFRNLSLKKKAIYFIFLVVGAYTLNLWSTVRAYSHTDGLISSVEKAIEYENSKSAEIEGPLTVLNKNILSITEGANAYVLIQVIEDFPDKYEYIYFDPYVKIVGTIIPRSLWPSKPQSVPLIFAKIYNPELEGFSLNGTLLGEGYASLGFFGVFLILICVLLLLYASKMIISKMLLDYYLASNICLFYGFLAIRYGALSDVFLMIIFSVLIVFTVKYLAKIIVKEDE